MAEAINLGALLGSVGGLGGGAAVGTGEQASGLFGTLLATAEGAEISLGDLVSNAQVGNNPVATLPLAAQTAPTGEQPVLVLGEATAVQLLLTRITIITEQLTVQGGFQFGAKGATGDLAAALTKLGLPPAEAQALATKIDTMLELLRQQAGLNREQLAGEAGTNLAALLLAAMVTPAQAQTLQLPESSTTTTTLSQVQVQVVQTQVVINVASWQAVQARAQSFSSASSLTEVVASTPAIPRLPASPSKLQAVATIETTLVNTPENPNPSPTMPSVAVALPVVAEVAAGLNQPKRSAVPTPTTEAVTTPTALTGTVLYRLTEVQPGTPVLQAVNQGITTAVVSEGAAEPDTSLVVEDGVLPAGAGLADVGSSPALLEKVAMPQVAQAATLAERLHQAQQAQAVQQVQLAIQPLLNNGQGGSVRMTLNPPELGKIEVHLKIENGQVQGVIAAQEPGVVEHLARELPTLRQSLVDAGLKIGDQGLSLMLGNQQQPDQQPGQNPFAALPEEHGRRQGGDQNPAFGTASAEELATGALLGRWVAPTQLVDVAA